MNLWKGDTWAYFNVIDYDFELKWLFGNSQIQIQSTIPIPVNFALFIVRNVDVVVFINLSLMVREIAWPEKEMARIL